MLTHADLKALAAKQRGKCLRYPLARKNYALWQCAHGHQWEGRIDGVKAGRWCSQCAQANQRTPVDALDNIARERGGKCVEYPLHRKRYALWECAQGHRWEARVDSVKAGRWCQVCARKDRRLSRDDLADTARSRGGRLLSTSYKNSTEKLLWTCQVGHRWRATARDVRSGTWCPKCAGNIPHALIDFETLAESRGGRCLSKEYRGVHRKLEWQCSYGHRWRATPDSVRRGTWCPECSSGLSERLCRRIFEELFNAKFPKARPVWLVGKKGRRLELDGYCESLGIAFEHQGRQHYSEESAFIKDSSVLRDRIEADRLKTILCAENSVDLICVPEIGRFLKLDEAREFVLDEAAKVGIDVPNPLAKIDFKPAYEVNGSDVLLGEVRVIAEQYGGKCLSKHYVDHRTKLEFVCLLGHKWRATPNSIKNGRWCPVCAGTLRLSIEDFQALAEERGGKCLSTEYVNQRTKLRFRCSRGHEWTATAQNVRNRNSWCPECARAEKFGRSRRNYTIEDMKQLAEAKRGVCLSDSYQGVAKALRWRCQSGHEFQLRPHSVLRGSWCRKCKSKRNETP